MDAFQMASSWVAASQMATSWMDASLMAAFCMATSNLQSSQTSLGETGFLCNPYILLTGCLGNQFLINPFPTQ